MINIWLYNYTFEFELTNRVSVINQQKNPFLLLNQCACFFQPFVKKDDFILCYNKPSKVQAAHLANRIGFHARFIEIKKPVMGKDLDYLHLEPIIKQKIGNKKFRISPWGRSPNINQLEEKLTGQKAAHMKDEFIKLLNSKLTSTYLRNCLLSEKYQIPSNILDFQKRDFQKQLNRELIHLHSVYLKDFFGVSGNLKIPLSKPANIAGILEKRADFFNQSEGILIEKVLDIKAEFSLQFYFKQNHCALYSVNGLISSKNGTYLGNTTNCKFDFDIDETITDLKPITDYIRIMGYKGFLGMDLIVTQKNEIKLLEINARYTMGIVASAWLNKLSPVNPGVFINTFFESSDPVSFDQFLDFLNKQSQLQKTRFTLIHYFLNPAPKKKHLLTLAFSAGDLMTLRALVGESMNYLTKERTLGDMINMSYYLS